MIGASSNLGSLVGHTVWLVLFLLFVFVYFILGRRPHDYEGRRMRDMAALARRLNLEFNADHDFELAARYVFLDPLRRGDSRYALNVLSGQYGGYPVCAFDYHFAGWSDNRGQMSVQHYFCYALVLKLERSFPELTIAAGCWRSRLAAIAARPSIDLESEEFSRAFTVKSADRRFAYDVCNARMMEYLLQNRDMVIEIEGSALGMFFEKRLKPAEVERNLDRLVRIRGFLPDYLFA